MGWIPPEERVTIEVSAEEAAAIRARKPLTVDGCLTPEGFDYLEKRLGIVTAVAVLEGQMRRPTDSYGGPRIGVSADGHYDYSDAWHGPLGDPLDLGNDI